MTKKWYNLLNTLKKGVFVLYRRCSVKKLATVSTLTVVLVACSSAVGYSDQYNTNKNTQINQIQQTTTRRNLNEANSPKSFQEQPKDQNQVFQLIKCA